MGLMREQFTLLFILFAIGFIAQNAYGDCDRPVFTNPYAITVEPTKPNYTTYEPIRIGCEDGHTQFGLEEGLVYCYPDGNWYPDPSAGLCYAQCNTTELIEDDDVKSTNDSDSGVEKKVFDHGENAYFECADKGQFAGSAVGTCDNGTLSVGSDPSCLAFCPVRVDEVGMIGNGLYYDIADVPQLNETTTIYYGDEDVITYRCLDGYDGPQNCSDPDCRSRCVDGSWDPDPPEIPVCVEIDECSSNPCENNATCEDQINGYLCQCAVGFNGTNCEENINDCVGHACQNGGTCVDKTDSYECQCPDGFNGYRCENEMTTMVMMTTAENVTATESGLTTVTDNVTITTSGMTTSITGATTVTLDVTTVSVTSDATTVTPYTSDAPISDASTVISGASTATPDASTAISDGTSHIPTTNQATTVSFTTIPEITTSATALPETTEASSNQSTSPEAKETTATKPTTSTTTPDASTAISDGMSHIPTTNQATTVSSTTIPAITTSATALPETTEATSIQSTSPLAKETTTTAQTTPQRTEKPNTTPLPCKGDLECLATQVCNVRKKTCECRSGYYEDETDSEIPCKEPVSIDVTLTITEVNGTAANFTEELNNSTSKEFKELESKVCQPFNEIYANDPEFVGCQVLNFSQGSIKVNYVLKFAENSTQNPSTVNQTIQDDLANPNGSFADEFTIDPNSVTVTPTEPQTTEPQPTEPKTTKEPEEPGLVPWKVIVGVTVPIVGILTISTIGLTCWQYRRQHRTSPSPSKKLNTFPYDDDYEEDKRNSLDRESGRPGSMRIINSDGTVQEVVLPWRNFAPDAEFVFGQDNNKRETQLLPMVDYPNEYSGSTSDENDPMRNIHGAFDNYTYEYHDTRKNTTEIDHSNFF